MSPQDSAWENLSNWTPGGPPNGPSDTATFGPSSQREVNISTSVGLNSIVFAFDSDSFDFSILGGELIISGTGIRQDSCVLQTFIASDGGQIIFNNMATADHAIIRSGGNLLGAAALSPPLAVPCVAASRVDVIQVLIDENLCVHARANVYRER